MQITTFPLVKAGIFFMAGIGFHAWLPIIRAESLAILLIIYFFLIWFSNYGFIASRIKSWLLLFIFSASGTYWIQQHHKKILNQFLVSPVLTIQGKLCSDPKQGAKSINAELEVYHILDSNEIETATHAKILVYLPIKAGQFLSCRKGDFLRVRGRIAEIRPNSNPGAFDFKKFCFYKGITQQIFVKESEWQVISEADSLSFTGFAASCRDKWSRKLDHVIKDKEKAGVVKALLLGVKDDVNEELYQHFSRTGAIHVLAVSGLHVGAVLYVFVLVFKRFKRHRILYLFIQPLLLSVIALFYLLLTGASPSVCRAVIMFGLILAGRIWFRGAHSINILMVSAIWMLLYDPNLMFNLSFQFSYLSLAGILLFQSEIRLWYIPENRFSTYIWELMSVSLAAQVLVFPLSVYYFNQFPVYFVLTNIIAIPMAIVLVYGGFVLLLLSELIRFPLGALEIVYTKLTGLFIDSIQWMASWPGAAWDNLYLGAVEVAILYSVVFFIYIYLQSRRREYFYTAVLLVFLLLCNQLKKEHHCINQSLICIYESNRDTVIDFFDGTTAFCIKSENVTLQKENALCRKNRLKNGIHNRIICNDSLFIRGENFCWGEKKINFKDKKISMAGYRYADIIPEQQEDILLILSGTEWPGASWFQCNKPLIILTGNLNKKEWQQWTTCLEESSISYRDVRREGYIEIDMNKVLQ